LSCETLNPTKTNGRQFLLRYTQLWRHSNFKLIARNKQKQMRNHTTLKQFFFLLFVFLFANCNSNQNTNEQKSNEHTMLKSEQINIDGLNGALTKLQNGKTEYEFIGITSNGIDCIYFIFENGKFNLEFEAMTEDQIPFIDKLKEFASSAGLKSLMTTYNNKPKYKSNDPAPVLRIETNATIDEITNLGTKIQSEIFHNNGKTVYDVVP
jgi:hypothetical protein